MCPTREWNIRACFHFYFFYPTPFFILRPDFLCVTPITLKAFLPSHFYPTPCFLVRYSYNFKGFSSFAFLLFLTLLSSPSSLSTRVHTSVYVLFTCCFHLTLLYSPKKKMHAGDIFLEFLVYVRISPLQLVSGAARHLAEIIIFQWALTNLHHINVLHFYGICVMPAFYCKCELNPQFIKRTAKITDVNPMLRHNQLH